MGVGVGHMHKMPPPCTDHFPCSIVAVGTETLSSQDQGECLNQFVAESDNDGTALTVGGDTINVWQWK